MSVCFNCQVSQKGELRLSEGWEKIDFRHWEFKGLVLVQWLQAAGQEGPMLLLRVADRKPVPRNMPERPGKDLRLQHT